MPAIMPLTTLETAPMLALNEAHVKETSHLSADNYESMIGDAFYARGVAPGDAFLIAFGEKAAYRSPNFVWFRNRYENFAYVDRIIVAAHTRGQGLARALYEDLFEAARAAGKPLIACEVNLDPPNPGSDAFHDKMGFEEVGTAQLENGKTVRYLIKKL